MRREVLSGRRDDELGSRSHEHRAHLSRARCDAGTRPAPARSRGSYDSRRGRFRSRARVSRDRPRRHRPPLPAASHRGRARDHPRGGGFRACGGPRIAATITAHHLLYNRSAMFAGGFRPHYYCLPVLKREEHREALVRAATGGNPKFFLGTDSAPHARADKETPCGHAGIYTAHAAIELYAEVFERAGALAKLEAFASFHGADFYRLPRNRGSITLRKETWTVPGEIPFGAATLVPLRAGESVGWRLA